MLANQDQSWFGLIAIPPSGLVSGDVGLVLRAYKCRVCTYVELHDVPQDEFDAALSKWNGGADGINPGN